MASSQNKNNSMTTATTADNPTTDMPNLDDFLIDIGASELVKFRHKVAGLSSIEQVDELEAEVLRALQVEMDAFDNETKIYQDLETKRTTLQKERSELESQMFKTKEKFEEEADRLATLDGNLLVVEGSMTDSMKRCAPLKYEVQELETKWAMLVELAAAIESEKAPAKSLESKCETALSLSKKDEEAMSMETKYEIAMEKKDQEYSAKLEEKDKIIAELIAELIAEVEMLKSERRQGDDHAIEEAEALLAAVQNKKREG